MITPGTHPGDQPAPCLLTPQAEAALDAAAATRGQRARAREPAAHDFGPAGDPGAEAVP